MRRRRSRAAGLGAVTLLLALPASPASAADGEFRYRYVGTGGINLNGRLTDPESGVCIDIPETEGNNFPALAPQNLTDSAATVFLEAHCDGDVFFVMPPGRRLGDRLRFRSVVFS
ncbi:hypothetical protein BJP40_05330 [Streptomyces sp. CC53]|uniref:hypothetical protein n=1 Tax=unclassified Streptomyces TaxID=2593676 RepID=UPI0008DE9B8C|nr:MULTISPECIES: hypothetical protein [unclassified Streptomyces]OII61449.1 hypothetical protein BJP40_05330 [Streptomyces sp. CC53]